MSISSVVSGPNSKSFEEVRIEDYIKAYQTTGRPPLPVPQEPVDEFQRKTLNLPPLFKPYSPSGPSNPFLKQATITNPQDIPPGQEFRALKKTELSETMIFQSMSCMNEYCHFSPEELRYYAYLRGYIKPPVPVAMDPFVQPHVAPSGGFTAQEPTTEKLQNICTELAYSKHSPEELRVAYMLHGRQLTSAELLQTPSAPGALFSQPALGMSSIPSNVTQPIFSAPPAAPSAPKFTFGLR
ncbi:hypothetical protein JR316_0002770 [Psilocybe cubensis]|uniref:Uncharacterized protein n=2 Tax=Psilocybe cubensis TaxID=181762 RepID=A0ACB8HFD2_PSICU|nr:hypothetical protein JR316_0002770 [Psilocybe cubensis]KAH9485855.1 hypothetical protein JR316_0002770 [Psilocybe cubensis]